MLLKKISKLPAWRRLCVRMEYCRCVAFFFFKVPLVIKILKLDIFARLSKLYIIENFQTVKYADYVFARTETFSNIFFFVSEHFCNKAKMSAFAVRKFSHRKAPLNFWYSLIIWHLIIHDRKYLKGKMFRLCFAPTEIFWNIFVLATVYSSNHFCD